MDHYEELGLKPDATAEEIRQAYRSLARLLHPDQQGEDGLRRLAEAQMKRLNAVYATLTDPARRRQYDASRAQTGALADLGRVHAVRRSWHCRDAGLVMAGMAVASLYWQLTLAPARRADVRPAGGTDPRLTTSLAKPATTPRLKRPHAKPRPQARKQPDERPLPTAQDGASRATTTGLVAEPFIRASEPEPGSAAALVFQPPALAASPPQLTGRGLRFAGTWVYVRPQVPGSQRLSYPADYIEAVIVEANGVLRGRYRARYAVADRPISSEVAFRFEGAATSDLAHLNWTGAGGSEGEVKLKLLSQNSMQLDWVARDLGTQLGLASGTAVLVRKQAPPQDRLRPPPRD